MEKQTYGSPTRGKGGNTCNQFLEKYVSEEVLDGSQLIKNELSNEDKEIQIRYAALVFTPKWARGKNGVILEQLLGIGDVREIIKKQCRRKESTFNYSGECAYYPLGIPKSSDGMLIILQATAAMISGAWLRHKTVKFETKWMVVGTFNVLQSLIFQVGKCSSKTKRNELLDYFLHIVKNICPTIFELDTAKSLILGEAADLFPHDVFHCALSRIFARQFCSEAFDSKIEKLSLLSLSLKRSTKYHKGIDLTQPANHTGSFTLCLLFDLIEDFSNGIINKSEILKEYDERLKRIVKFIGTQESPGLLTNLKIFVFMLNEGKWFKDLITEEQAYNYFKFCTNPLNSSKAVPFFNLNIVNDPLLGLFSSTVNIKKEENKAIALFPAKLAMVAFRQYGTYKIHLKGSLNAKFSHGKEENKDKTINCFVSYSEVSDNLLVMNKLSKSYCVLGNEFNPIAQDSISFHNMNKKKKAVAMDDSSSCEFYLKIDPNKTVICDSECIITELISFGPNFYPSIKAQNCKATIELSNLKNEILKPYQVESDDEDQIQDLKEEKKDNEKSAFDLYAEAIKEISYCEI